MKAEMTLIDKAITEAVQNRRPVSIEDTAVVIRGDSLSMVVRDRLVVSALPGDSAGIIVVDARASAKRLDVMRLQAFLTAVEGDGWLVSRKGNALHVQSPAGRSWTVLRGYPVSFQATMPLLGREATTKGTDE